jgi:hypothetical protein
MSPKKDLQMSARSTGVNGKKPGGFSDEERAALKERARELKAAASADNDKAEGESAVLARIAELQELAVLFVKGCDSRITIDWSPSSWKREE